MQTILTNCTIISNGSVLKNNSVLLQGGQISDIVPNDHTSRDANVIDLGGAYLAPGLIDLQIYGSGGKLFGGSPSAEALEQMEGDLFSQGTTGFLATVATNTPEIVEQAIAAAKAFRPKAKGNFLGLHLEGPYLNQKRKGAHPADLIKKATLEELKKWVDMAEGEIRMITIAPELQDQSVINYLNDQQIVISCGHSDATYEQAIEFFRSDIPAATHLYNAMPPMHHREPGFIPALFKQKPYTSIVADGVHVNFAMIEFAKKQLGDKLFFITDAVTATTEGIYPHIFSEDRYVMPDGTLSGSCLTMLNAIKNCTRHAHIPLEEAVNMGNLYPSRLIRSELTGEVKKGMTANLTVFDADFNVLKTIYKGQTFYSMAKN